VGLGQRAEAMAAACLERKGMRIIVRNWRRPECELDLVALDTDGTCVFCEVRSRTGEATGDPLETINVRKQARVIRAARLFLASDAAIAATAYRFDVVAITFFEDRREPRIVHIPAAFETGSWR
jgi:putative endonuclease